MEENIIYNPAYNKRGFIWVNHNFIKQVNMFDKIMFNKYDSVQEGYVALISRRGVNINVGYGDRFVKWCHIIGIKK